MNADFTNRKKKYQKKTNYFCGDFNSLFKGQMEIPMLFVSVPQSRFTHRVITIWYLTSDKVKIEVSDI
jgi:hypothetical protein